MGNDDGNAERLVNEHAALLRAALGSHFVPLQTAVNAFDCELALTVLQDAMTHHKVEIASTP